MKDKKLIDNILNSILDESNINSNPVILAKEWYEQAIEANVTDPTAISLATCGIDNKPSVRYVLLKRIEIEGFIFYTNYESRKASQLEENSNAAIAMYWPSLERQIRIEGVVEKLSEQESDEYFDSRPEGSRIGAWASPQSKVIPNRSYLDNLKHDFDSALMGKNIVRPEFWGGYILIPERIEFWKSRENRLHDRIEYIKNGAIWNLQRLAP